MGAVKHKEGRQLTGRESADIQIRKKKSKLKQTVITSYTKQYLQEPGGSPSLSKLDNKVERNHSIAINKYICMQE